MTTAFINPVVLDISHQMANQNWQQYYVNGQLDDEIDHLHLTTTADYTSAAYQSHVPATTNTAFNWSMPTALNYSTTYSINNTQGLSSAQMEPSYSASSASSSQQQAVSRRSSDQEAAQTSQQYHALLQQFQPGTAEYNKVLAAYQQWYTNYQNGANTNATATKENSPNPEYDDDDNSTEFSLDTPAGPAVSRAVQVTGKDGKARRVFPCPACTHQSARKADLTRHYNSMHLKGSDRLLPCPEAGCARTEHRGFTRKDHLIEHLRNFHHKEEDYPKKGRKDRKGESKRRTK